MTVQAPDRERDGLISGSAILGFYAAIKICIRDGYDPRSVFEVVLKGAFPDETNVKRKEQPCDEHQKNRPCAASDA